MWILRPGGVVRLFSTCSTMGVFDLKTGRNREVIEPNGFNGVGAALFVDSSHVAAVTDWKLRVWDVTTGVVTFDRHGPYVAAVPISATQVLAASHEGLADVIDVRRGRVRRTLCLTQSACPKERDRLEPYVNPPLDPAKLTKQEFALYEREIEIRRSPDGRLLAVLENSETDDTTGEKRWLAPVSIFSLPGLKRVATAKLPLSSEAGRIRVLEFVSPDRLNVRGMEVHVPDLTVISQPAPGWTWDDILCPEGATLCTRTHLSSQREAPDDVTVRARDGAVLLTLAAAETPERSRAQARYWSALSPSPDGSRFVLASRYSWLQHSSNSDPKGALQVWCMPTEPVPPIPPEPPLPDVVETEGLREHSKAALPPTLRSLTVLGTDAVVLGEEKTQCGNAPCSALVRVTPDGSISPLELPPGEVRWESVSSFPGSTALWLEGRGAVAVNVSDAPWKVITVPEKHRVAFTAVGGNQAVRVRKLLCPVDVRTAPVTDAEIEKLHRDTLREVIVPETVTGQLLLTTATTPEAEERRRTRAHSEFPACNAAV